MPLVRSTLPMANWSKTASLCRDIYHFLKVVLSQLAYIILRLLTASYYPRLQNYTVRPLENIARHAKNRTQLIIRLEKFKVNKKRELEFVRISSTLSAVADIGIFAWPIAGEGFWIAKVFWYWSLSCAFFSLISSTVDQLLEWLPSKGDPEMAEERLAAILKLLIKVPESSAEPAHPRAHMIWVWQCPAMLMSWSWVLFYAGLLLLILTPVLPNQLTPSETKIVITTIIGCGLPILNFVICGNITSSSLWGLRDIDDM